MIRLTSNINDEILKELIDRSPGCPQSCSICNKPKGVCCVTWAQNANCFKMLSNFNDYVMFSTGTNALGFRFAVNKKVLSNFLTSKNCPWKMSVEDCIELCGKDNKALVNNEALRLFELIKHNSIYHSYKEPAQLLGDGYFWRRYSDASGCLENMYGKSVVSYDACKLDEIEYQFAKAYGWEWFYGPFEDFKIFAEETVKAQNF